jgi:8-oxo-dGTP pyrophosphatase MutT (NUDIX family)
MSNEALFQVSVKGLIKNNKGDILLLHSTPDEVKQVSGTQGGCWDLPGGRAHVGETIKETLLREVAEETQISNLENLSFFMSTPTNVSVILDHSKSVDIILFAYTCTIPVNTEVQLGLEHDSYKWCSIAEARTLLAPNFPERFLNKVAELAMD